MNLCSTTPEYFNDVSADQILDVFKEQGFSAERANLDSGKSYIRFKVEGYTSRIYFYGESDNRPGFFNSLQFNASFRDKISMEKANQWNLERRLIKVYSDSDGELQFDLDVPLEGGVSRKYLMARIEDWRALFSRVLGFVTQ